MIGLDAFVSKDRAFLDGALPRRSSDTAAWGVGSDRISIMEEFGPEVERAFVARACDWQRTRFDAGLGWITGPPELGGRGLSLAMSR